MAQRYTISLAQDLSWLHDINVIYITYNYFLDAVSSE